MAKSKLIKTNEKIAEVVVGGYKKIEEGAVGGFNKIADKFVDNFLTKEGESVEEAKVRLEAERKEREAKSMAKREEREQKQKAMLEANIQKTEAARLEARRKEVMNNEKEYICSNDFRNDWRDFVRTWYVYGVDSGMECVPAGSHYGSGWYSCAAYYGACMEKDGKQGTHQVVRKDDRCDIDWNCWYATAGWRYVSDDGMEQYGCRYYSWDYRDCSSFVSDSIHQRIKVIRI